MKPKTLDLSAIGDFTRVIEAAQQDDGSGFCIACGAEAGGLEPDARRRLCDSCGAHTVYGAEELLIMTVA